MDNNSSALLNIWVKTLDRILLIIVALDYCVERQTASNYIDAASIYRDVAVRVVEKPDVDQRGSAIDPQSIYVYPDYNSITLDNDIGLIKLSEKVIFNDYVKPICLPDPNFTVRMDDEVDIAGWGMTPTGMCTNGSHLPLYRDKTTIYYSETLYISRNL